MRMRPWPEALRGVLLAALLCAVAVPAAAGRAGALIEALRLDELLEVMRQEGMENGAEIGESMLEPSDAAAWAAAVRRIYAPARMAALLRDGLERGLPEDPAALAPVLDFFGSDRGRKLVELELSARRAMLDDDIDAAARAAWEEKRAEGGARVEALLRFIAAGDLIEENVVGGLNATHAFYVGLLDSGAGTLGRGDARLMAEVWAQEPGIRAEIEAWVPAYLALAFGPLEDEALEAYVAFMESPAGGMLSAALFSAFNGMFEAVSRDLGLAAGGLLLGEDI